MNRKTALGVAVVVVAGVAALGLLVGNPFASGGEATAEGVDTFDSSAEFESYVENARSNDAARRFDAPGGGEMQADAAGDGDASGDGGGGVDAEASSSSDRMAEPGEDDGPRIGTTNVQEGSIDEPDLVKTDGRHFYYSPDRGRRYVTHDDDDDRVRRGSGAHVIDASEPANPRRISGINDSGRLLVVGETLVVLRGDRVVGYDVSSPDDPTRQWERELNGSLVSARATGGQVYLVVSSRLGRSPECPVEPMEGASVSCGDIHHPEEQVPVDATYTALALDPSSGTVTDSVGFVGTTGRTTVYMSANALYVTYTDPMNRDEIRFEAMLASDEVPRDVKERLREIRSYNLSSRAQEEELEYTIREWLQSLSHEERERTEDELEEDVQNYVEGRSREFSTTGIVRVDVGGDGGDLTVSAHGTVPGRPLNQFSLDEHEGRLRIATTVPGIDRDSENDLYTLDAESLDRLGSVQGMAEGQRIYSVRYVGDTAYVVTFRRVDPLHVVDLSNPSDPVERGIKKLPGFSRYLHPVDENHVLGVGEEDGEVKTVLFNVSDPTNPTIADSKIYEQDWSRVSRTHHAFTMDRRHGVFFLPAEDDGLVVDYTNESLSVQTTIRTEGVTRARYVGDYLYVFGQNEVVVVDETTWNRTATLSLRAESER